MKIAAFILNIFIGFVFLYSAYLKLDTIDFFEAKISFFGIEGVLAAVLARLIISAEFLLGLILVMQLTLGKKVHKITILVLILFIIINLIDLIKYGNDTNCGCMGMNISISPLMSIVKNLVLIVCTFISLRFSKISLKLPSFTVIVIALIPFSVVYMYRPVYIYDNYKMPKKGTRPDFNIMNGHPGFKGKTYTEDLSKGKKIVAFLSLGCPHCKMAAYKLNGYKAANPELPIYFIYNGDSSKLEPFIQVMGKPRVEMCHFNQGNTNDFANMSGYDLPAIFLLNNGVVEIQLNNGNLSRSTIENWLKKK